MDKHHTSPLPNLFPFNSHKYTTHMPSTQSVNQISLQNGRPRWYAESATVKNTFSQYQVSSVAWDGDRLLPYMHIHQHACLMYTHICTCTHTHAHIQTHMSTQHVWTPRTINSQLCSTGCDTIQNISDNTSEVPLILLHNIHHSQSGSGGTTELDTITQISSILLPLVCEVAASGHYRERDVCPWNHI